jgi:hypothetical protein
VERGRRHDAQHDPPAFLEGDQARPHRDAARVVARAVDRVDQPASPPRAGLAALLAEDRVAAPLRPEDRAELVLDRLVCLGHRRPVGLRVNDEVTGPEAAERDRVGGVREPQRELEIRGHGGTQSTWR